MKTEQAVMIEAGTEPSPGVNWRHVGAFLLLTFGLSWLLDLAIYLRGGLSIPGIVTILQLQMLMPAFSAIVLGLWFFPESPLYHERDAGRGRWFYYYFILLTLVFACGALAVWLSPSPGITGLAGTVPLVLAIAGLVVLLGLRLNAGREAMARVWLSWGNRRYYVLFGVGIFSFYVLQAVLNAILHLGPSQLAPIPTPPGFGPESFLITGAVQSVVLAPILFIVIAFGEEYGWRGYLQSELFKLGRVRGVVLLGVIWGMWHWPVILMGYSYPGYPLPGLVLTALFTTGLAIVLGYAVLKSGSILLAAYLHALNDQTTAFLVALGFKPFDPVYSFGVGIYAIVMLAIISLLILRDPVWRGKGGNLP